MLIQRFRNTASPCRILFWKGLWWYGNPFIVMSIGLSRSSSYHWWINRSKYMLSGKCYWLVLADMLSAMWCFAGMRSEQCWQLLLWNKKTSLRPPQGPDVRFPKMLTLRRDDAAARAVIGPLTKTRGRTKTGSRLCRTDWVIIMLRRRGNITEPLEFLCHWKVFHFKHLWLTGKKVSPNQSGYRGSDWSEVRREAVQQSK